MAEDFYRTQAINYTRYRVEFINDNTFMLNSLTRKPSCLIQSNPRTALFYHYNAIIHL